MNRRLKAISKLTSNMSVVIAIFATFMTASSSVSAEEQSLETFPLNIYRTDQFINRGLSPTIFVNNKEVGKLTNGNNIVLNVPAGVYTIALKGAFPDWLEKYNRVFEVIVTEGQPVFVRLESIYTGFVTPTEAETNFTIYQVENMIARTEVKPLFSKVKSYLAVIKQQQLAGVDAN